MKGGALDLDIEPTTEGGKKNSRERGKTVKVCVLQEDPGDLRSLCSYIKRLHFNCVSMQFGDRVGELIASECPDVVMIKGQFRNKTCVGIFNEIKHIMPDIPVILLNSNGARDFSDNADVLPKEKVSRGLGNPLHEKALDFDNQSEDLSRSRDGAGTIVGNSVVMQELLRNTKKIAQCNGNVLISGESGTGKELIARMIHAIRKQSLSAWVPVDCVALPDSLMESELFGFEKGAFTGAIARRRGLLELAHNGTLFLDEICELRLNLQAKLLRVLQEREFRRIGGKELIRVNLRVIAATNKNPEMAMRTGRLREDLYYRLNVLPLELPPLRKKTEDIPELIRYFLHKYRRRTGEMYKNMDAAAIEALINYNWPGNVRELQNIVERSVAMVDGAVIHERDLPSYVTDKRQNNTVACTTNLSFAQQRKMLTQEFEAEFFGNLLREHKGNITHAAQSAKVSRRTLYRMIRVYDLEGLVAAEKGSRSVTYMSPMYTLRHN